MFIMELGRALRLNRPLLTPLLSVVSSLQRFTRSPGFLSELAGRRQRGCKVKQWLRLSACPVCVLLSPSSLEVLKQRFSTGCTVHCIRKPSLLIGLLLLSSYHSHCVQVPRLVAMAKLGGGNAFVTTSRLVKAHRCSSSGERFCVLWPILYQCVISCYLLLNHLICELLSIQLVDVFSHYIIHRASGSLTVRLMFTSCITSECSLQCKTFICIV